MSKGGQLSALVDIIAQATKLVEAAYAAHGGDGIPSLDDTTEHPLDAGPSEQELRNAVQIIQGACAQLSATVGRPSHVILNKYMGFYEAVALRIVLEFNIADVLENHPEGVHVSEISKASGVDERKLARILRLLTAKHVFREGNVAHDQTLRENVFANNRLSTQLISSNPMSKSGLHLTEEMYCSATFLPEILADPVWGPSQSPTQTPFNKWTGCEDPAFIYYEGVTAAPKGAERGARFSHSMVGWNRATEASALLRDFPWSSLPHGATICDVGGGIGDVCIDLAKRQFPNNLCFILQDLPKRVQQAKEKIWPVRCPEALQEEGRIHHNWPDKECLKILSGVQKSMTKKDSRLLIHEYIIQPGYRPSSSSSPEPSQTTATAPLPLLPNYGEGRIRQYYIDMDMMVILNSQERSLSEYTKLARQVGLEFVRVWNVGDMGMVEFKNAEET